MRLHSIRHGDDLPVRFVLVHGLASCARLWDGVGAALAERGHGSVAVDVRGHGESPKPDDGYDFVSVTSDLLPFLDDLPIVVGQSYGGNVALHLAAMHPDALRAAACVDGGAIDLTTRFPSLDDATVALRPPYERFEGITPGEMEAFVRAGHPDWPEVSIRAALAAFDVDAEGRIRARLSWARHRRIIRAMWDTPPSGWWPAIRVPVLFLMASEAMRDGVERALAVLPEARAVWFDGADHDLHAQRPDEVADHLTGLAAHPNVGSLWSP